jgi:hypothetical protein
MPADPEVPEADALEQAAPVGPETDEPRPASKPRTAFEIPEADALEQAREVPLDDDDRR